MHHLHFERKLSQYQPLNPTLSAVPGLNPGLQTKGHPQRGFSQNSWLPAEGLLGSFSLETFSREKCMTFSRELLGGIWDSAVAS